MNVRFNNKVVVITGSARGIGLVIAKMALESGAKVVRVDILENRLKETARQLKKLGTVKDYVLDLRKVKNIGPAVAKIRKQVGEIDVLIQPAAVGPQRYAEDMTEKEWDDIFAVNAKGLFFMMREVVVQSMAPRKKGSIVNFSSIAGIVGMKRPLCSAHYSGSKGAAVAITRQAAIEWARYGIRVNAICTGGVLTEMTKGLIGDKMAAATAQVPLGRLSKPEEVAAAVLFLASDWSANTTNHIMVVDGGGYGAQSDPAELTPAQIKAYAV